MPASTPRAILLFGLFDPTGRIDIPADNVTCAANGAHGLAIATGFALADSTGLHAVERISAEVIDDQARYLLEDIPINAIKAGNQVCPECVSVIASVAADYNEAPLVVQLGPQEGPPVEPSHDLDAEGPETCVSAVLEMLVPQAAVVVMPASAIGRWLNEEVLHPFDPNDGPAALLSLGANWVLFTGHSQRPGSLVNLLLGPEGETIALPCQAPPQRVQDLSGLTATALACALANGQSVPEAARTACAFAERAGQGSFQAGMGQKLAGNPWQREP